MVAVDISDKFLDHARQTYSLPNLSFEKLDLLADDLGRFGRFDLVFGNGILHHLVVRLDDVLRALHSLSNAGGGLAFIEPNFLNPYCAFIFGTRIGRRFAKLEPDEMAFTPGQLASCASAGGLAGGDGDDQRLSIARSAGSRRAADPRDRARARGYRGDPLARAVSLRLGKSVSRVAV